MADTDENMNEVADEGEDVSHPADTYSHRSFDNCSILSMELSDVSMFITRNECVLILTLYFRS